MIKRLGGLRVSGCALGCMSFGDPSHKGIGRHQWTIDDEDLSRNMIKIAFDKFGVNFFDTANVYSSGDSERMVGKLLKDIGLRRSEYVLATKFGLPMGDKPNETGCSRKHIMDSIDASLERLGVDHVDLFIVHRLDNFITPPEETMEALHDVVKSGKSRYIGASSMYAWEFAKLQSIAQENGWTKFVSMQNHYNLLYREEEREMLPMLHDQNVLCTPWSPLARGILARPPNFDTETKRASLDPLMNLFDVQENIEILNAVGDIAQNRGITRSAVSLAWLASKGCVPVIGATSLEQLEQTLEFLNIDLTKDEIKSLEKGYSPKPHGVGIGRDAKSWS